MEDISFRIYETPCGIILLLVKDILEVFQKADIVVVVELFSMYDFLALSASLKSLLDLSSSPPFSYNERCLNCDLGVRRFLKVKTVLRSSMACYVCWL